MRRITSKEILIVSAVLAASFGASSFQEPSITINDQGRLTFVSMVGVRGGLAQVDALTKAGFNTKSDGDLTTGENGVAGADGAIVQTVWIKIHDIDAPLFENEDEVLAEAQAKIKADAKDAGEKIAAAKARDEAEVEANEAQAQPTPA